MANETRLKPGRVQTGFCVFQALDYIFKLSILIHEECRNVLKQNVMG